EYANLSNVLRSCYSVLSLRDHSSHELRKKQITKGYDPDLVEEAIEKLIKDGYINDELFAQGYFNSRIIKGHGPIRIQRDMTQKLIPDELIKNLVSARDEEYWIIKAIKLKLRKFGDEFFNDQKWKAKVSRYLAYRGYLYSHIKEALNPNSDYLDYSSDD
ncbi:MAG: regulatory protein RecX, partial [Methylococcales bacterium]